MKKNINAKIILLVFVFVFEMVFNSGVKVAKGVEEAPTLQSSGNISTFIKGETSVAVDPNMTLTGGNNIDGVQVYIGQGFVSSQDSLVFNNQNNITGTYNSSTGVLTLSGIDTTANYQAALRSIKYSNSSSNPSTAQRKIVFSVGGKVLYCPTTKHYYEYVSAPGIRWDSAKTAAAGKSYYGLTGYLVTLTSKEENDFVQQKIAGNTWIGASDDDQLGHWTWRTGPEAGQCFWNRTTGSQSKTISDTNYTYNGMYNNWDSNEPNNYNGINEFYAHMYSNSGKWNDFKIDDTTIAGYVVEYSENDPKNPTLHLAAEVSLNFYASPSSTPTLSASSQNADNMINLSWNPNDSTQTYHYMVNKRDISLNETTYQTIPLKATAKVLNIYPGGGTAIAGVTDLDGNIVDTSGSAKQWMQAYGNGKITLDSVYIDNFSSNPDKYLKDSSGNYKYDVVFVGSWDSNNFKDISLNGRNAIQEFINAGGGYLSGHDTAVALERPNFVALSTDKMNMVCDKSLGFYGKSSGYVNISVLKKGSLTNYPWNLSSNTLSVPASHTTFQFAKGYVWMKYDSPDVAWSSLSTTYGGATGTNNFYLTTWNNTAMIQTGHSNGSATEDEQKILANTLLYLSQVSAGTSFSDHTSQDVTAPNAVSNIGINIDVAKKAKIVFDAVVDKGNTYEYQLKAFGDTDKKTYTSNTVQSTITSGIKGYALVVDKNPSTDPGNSVTTTSSSFTSDALTNGTWYVHIKAIDNAGNVSSIVHKSFNVAGNNAPVLTNVVPSKIPIKNIEGTNDNGKLVSDILYNNITDADGNANSYGIAVVAADSSHGNWEYSMDGSQWYTLPKSSPVLSDTNALLLPGTARIRYSPGENFNGTASISYRVWDRTCGSNEGRYDTSTNGGSTAFSTQVGTATAAGPVITINSYTKTLTNGDVIVKANTDRGTLNEGSHTFTENGSFGFVATDADGNVITKKVTITNIDKAAPSFTSITQNPTGPAWTNQFVKLTVNGAVDNGAAGLDSAAYSFSTTEEVYNWQASNVSQAFLQNQTVYVYVRDALGNISTVSTAVISNIDNTLPNTPVINNSSNYTNSKWYGTDQNVSAGFTATSGCNETLQYSLNNGAWINGSSVKVSEVGVNTLKFRVMDELNRISGEVSCTVQIDKTNPTVIASDTNYSWRNSNFNITANYNDVGGSGVSTRQYAVTNSTAAPAIWETANSSQTIAITEEGQWYIHYKITDAAGNITTGYYGPYKIDKTAPANAKITIKDREFTSVLNKITFGIFFKETVNVSITADGNISGIKTIEYQKVAKDTEYNLNGTWTSGSSFNVNPDEKFVVYARITDNAGNYVVINSDGVVVDATKPALTLTPSVSNWTNSNVNVKVNASDALAGVKEVTYTTNETTPQAGTVALSSGEGNITLSNEGQYVLTVTAKDNSDNEVSQTANIKINKTAPAITSVTSNTTDWTSEDVTLTVNTGDTLSGLAAKAYSFDGGSTWQAENTKTFAENTSNIVVKVKDAVGNVATYGSIINITKIDKTVPNTAVIADSAKYTAKNWYKDAQTITASYAATAGCTEKLQYKVNDGAWTDGASVTVSTEGKYDVSYRVIDSLGRASTAQTVKVNIDNTAPTNAKITVKDREFTSILNKITFGIFFKETVNVSITAEGNISGIKTTEYQKVAKDTDYNLNGTWTSGSSFDVTPDDKFVVYAKITDNAGNYVVVNSDGIVVDSTNPDLALTPDAADWTSKDVNVKVEASDKLAGVKEVTYTTDEKTPQSGTVAISDGKGTIKLSKEGQYKLTVTAKDNSGNEVSQSVDIKIDRTIPKFTGAADASSYFIGRVIKLADDFGEIASATYKKDADDETSFNNEALFDKAGKYALTLKDKAGNSNKVSFEIKAMPKVEDIVYTADCKALIDSIRAEFNSHSDLTEPYKTNTDNEIKALEARYAKLDKEVKNIKAETSVIKGKVDVLPKEVDGLISFKKEIQDEYNKIAGDTFTLTKEQKLALEKEAEYLKQQLDIIAQLQSQIDAVKTRVSNTDTKVDGLISKEGSIKEILTDVDKLTKEQKNILQPQIDILNGLVNKINVLKEEVETVKGMISKLPSAEKVTKENLEQLTSAEKAYNKLNNEQKGLVGDYLVNRLNDCLDALRKLMLHNEENDLTVIGIDGTSFDSSVYLVVEPIKADGTNASITAKFAVSTESVKKAAETNTEIKNKELVALYDVSLFKDNVKVQPDGKVKVKIKISEELKGRTGLDIVHIADDGTVTPMHAVVEGEYLVFITTHFSEYAIIAEPIAKAAATTIPKTGSVFDFNSVVALGVLLTVAGSVVVRRQRRKA